MAQEETGGVSDGLGERGNVIPETFFCIFSRAWISLFEEHLLFNTSLSRKTRRDGFFNGLLVRSLKCMLST